jgi:hypothetical protein
MTNPMLQQAPRAEVAGAGLDDRDAVLHRLDRIEDQLRALAEHIRHLRPPHTAGILVGWREIARYLRKSPRTLRRYVEREGLPVMRWGRHVVTTPTLIDGWFLARERVVRSLARPAGPKEAPQGRRGQP